jgi:hypothetical protein
VTPDNVNRTWNEYLKQFTDGSKGNYVAGLTIPAFFFIDRNIHFLGLSPFI